MIRFAIVALATLVALPALAADPPYKIDFTTPVIIDGKPQIDEFKCPVVNQDDVKLSKAAKRDCETPITVGELVYFALERPVPNSSWTDAIKHDDLARAVRTAHDFPLLDEQKIMIENAMGPVWAPPMLGFVKTVIEPAPINDNSAELRKVA